MTDSTPAVPENVADIGPRPVKPVPLEEIERRLVATVAGSPAKLLRVYEILDMHTDRFTSETVRNVFAAALALASANQPCGLANVAHALSSRKDKAGLGAAARARELAPFRKPDLDVEAEARYLAHAYAYADAARMVPDVSVYRGLRPLEEYATACEDYARRVRDAALHLRPVVDEQLAVHVDAAVKEYHDDDDARDWLVEGLIGRQSVGFLVGESQVGKTVLGVQLTLCVANGRDVLGHHVAQPARVLYLIAEGSRAQFISRLRTACKSLGVKEPSGPWFMQRDGASVFEVTKPGFESIVASARPELVVLDTGTKFAPQMNENHVDEWRAQLYTPLFNMTQRYGTTFLLLDHESKAGAEGFNKLRGSTGKTGDTDFVLQMEAHDETGRALTLHARKVRGRAKFSIPLIYHAEDAWFEAGYARATTGAALPALRDAAVEAVRSAASTFDEGFVPRTQIMGSVRRSPGLEKTASSTLVECIAGLLTDGLLERKGSTYRVPQPQGRLVGL